MEDVGRVDVLQTSEDLVEKVADVVIAQVLSLQQLVEIGLHEDLHDVGVFDYCLDLPQYSLTGCLVLKGQHLLDGHLGVGDCVYSRGRCPAAVDQGGSDLGYVFLYLDLHLNEGVRVETHLGLDVGLESHQERWRRSRGVFHLVDRVGVLTGALMLDLVTLSWAAKLERC